GDVLRSLFSGLQTRWTHKLQVYVPTGFAKKDINHLPRHIERGEDDADEHQVMGQTGERPVRGAMQNFFFGPATGKEEWYSTQIHHADGVGKKCHRHDPAQAAHFANVLFVMKAVNDGAGAKEEERFEKAMRDQMHNAGGNAADSERDHHQSELRDGGIGENAFDIELCQGDERSHQRSHDTDRYDYGE